MEWPFLAVRSLLLADAALSAVVAGRIFVLAAPQNAPVPHIILIGAGQSSEVELDGKASLYGYRISVECRANTVNGVGSANAIGAAAIACLSGFQGAAGGVEIDRIVIAGDAFFWQDDAKLARRIVDFRVFPA